MKPPVQKKKENRDDTSDFFGKKFRAFIALGEYDQSISREVPYSMSIFSMTSHYA